MAQYRVVQKEIGNDRRIHPFGDSQHHNRQSEKQSSLTAALVRQYRHPARKYLLEIPAGSLAPGEDPKTGAERELEEEIGVRAARVEKLAEFYVSPGFLGEKMFVFLATDFTASEQNLEDDELLKIDRIPLRTCGAMIKNGDLEDAKTIIGLTLAAARFGIQFF